MEAKRLDVQVLSALKNLDVRPELARRALAQSIGAPSATLEERLRAALRALGGIYATGCREVATTYRFSSYQTNLRKSARSRARIEPRLSS